MENVLNPSSTDGWFYNLINCTDSYYLLERKDGTILTSTCMNKMKVYNIFKLECIKEIIINLKSSLMVYDATELANGNLVVAFDNTLLIYDGNNYELKNNINEYKSTVHALYSLKDNKFISASYEDSRL